MAREAFNITGYQHLLTQRKIMACRCADCGQIFLPPRPICRECRSWNMAWVELSGKGAVVAFTSISVVPAIMAKRGYGRDRPYLSGFVRLKEGLTIPARIEESRETAVSIGTAVKAEFREESTGEQEHVTLVFRPV